MKGNARINRMSQYPLTRRWLSCIGIIAVAVAFALPAAADRRDRSDSDSDSHDTGSECHETIKTFQLDDSDAGNFSWDKIVPVDLQDLVTDDRDSVTGVWVSELELFTNVNAEACKVPKKSVCATPEDPKDPNSSPLPRQPLSGACPEGVQNPDGNMFKCAAPLVWTNNTVAHYELSTGSIYSVNVWRIWFLYEQLEDGTEGELQYPTPESVIESGDDPGAHGYVFMNGVRNEDDRILSVSSVGEIVLTGASTGGHPDLADRIVMAGQVYDSNVGRVILSNTLTDTGISLIYAPGDPREAVWKINLRKEPHCVDSEEFSELIFPSSTKKIRIKRDRD